MEGTGIIESLANLVGSPEPALRLLIALLLGYPIAFFHRRFLYGKSPTIQHLYFIVTGCFLCYFNYGFDLVHSFCTITLCYLTLKILGGGLFSLITVFTYTMIHLLVGYWVTATSTYDIKWTMPHCVLTLRLIAVAFNLYDGQEPEDDPYKLPDSVQPGLHRFSQGLLYLTIYQVGSLYITDDLMTSDEFKGFATWKQWLLLGLWGRFALYKYISCWLITEGACIVLGLTYNGVDENNKAKWDGCSNVKLMVFECATKMDHYIDSFNINTNSWVAQYIYKRLKFLNNRVYSQFGALLFLAVWHGFHSGYYATFFFEFITILAEKRISAMLEKNEVILGYLTSPYLSPFVYVFSRVYTFMCMGYAMIPFILLKYRKYVPLYLHFHFNFHVLFLSIIAFTPLIKKYIIRPKRQNVSEATTSNEQSSRSRSKSD